MRTKWADKKIIIHNINKTRQNRRRQTARPSDLHWSDHPTFRHSNHRGNRKTSQLHGLDGDSNYHTNIPYHTHHTMHTYMQLYTQL